MITLLSLFLHPVLCQPYYSDTIQGVDVSTYQGDIDFPTLKKNGITYVFIKATQGITYKDPRYGTNSFEARKAGLIMGAYHYYMTDDAPLPQAKNFIATSGLKSGDLPPVVDIEALAKKSKPQLTKNLQLFLNALEKNYGVKPIVYSGEYFANQHLTSFGAYPLWLAEYGASSPTVPKGWTKWTFWQYSQSAKVPGVQGDVDADRFNGDRQALNALLIP